MLKNRVFIIQIRYENSICQEGTKKMTLTTRVVNLVKEKAPHANLRVEALDCQQVTKKMPAQNSDMDLNLQEHLLVCLKSNP